MPIIGQSIANEVNSAGKLIAGKPYTIVQDGVSTEWMTGRDINGSTGTFASVYDPFFSVPTAYMDGRVASYSQADFMALIAQSDLNQAHIGLVGLQQTGIEFVGGSEAGLTPVVLRHGFAIHRHLSVIRRKPRDKGLRGRYRCAMFTL